MRRLFFFAKSIDPLSLRRHFFLPMSIDRRRLIYERQ